jgi:hypothetical protein
MKAGTLIGLVLVVFLAGPSVALAKKKRCGRVDLANGGQAKVLIYKGPLACRTARRVAQIYYDDRQGGDWDGRFANGAIYYSIHGWKCAIGLGGSQLFCYKGKKRFDASERDDDGWHF